MARPNNPQEATQMLEDVKQWANNTAGEDLDVPSEIMEDLSNTAEEAKDAIDTLYSEWGDSQNDDPDENSGEDEGGDDEDEESDDDEV